MDTIIISGGSLQSEFALPFLKKNIEENNTDQRPSLVGADRGFSFFTEHNIIPDLAIGDFDSLSEKGRAQLDFLEQEGALKVIRLKPEKDDSDTQSALNYMIEQGAKDIVILGATGTRLDHVMANLGLLLLGEEKGVKVTIQDANNRICLIDSGTVLKKEDAFGTYVSFFPLGGDVEGLTLKGFKYSLQGYHLRTRDSGLTVSNELKDQEAEVLYEKGKLLMIMSRD